jgi:hypothetical protein
MGYEPLSRGQQAAGIPDQLLNQLYPNFHNDFGFDAEKMLFLLVGSSREPLAKEALVLIEANGVMKLKLITSALRNTKCGSL